MAEKTKTSRELKKFKREALLKSKHFSYVPQDFLQAILTEEYYTIEEAEKAVSEFYGGEA